MSKTMLVIKEKNRDNYIAQGNFTTDVAIQRGVDLLQKGKAVGFAVLDIVGGRVVDYHGELTVHDIVSIENSYRKKQVI